MDQYYRSLDTFYRRRQHYSSGDGDEVHERIRPNWHPALPDPPDDWLERTTLDLRWKDAEFLAERIVTAAPSSLLAHFLRDRVDVSAAPLPWEVGNADDLPDELRQRLDHARRFSLVMHSAPLLSRVSFLLAQSISNRAASLLVSL
jgi:hypothetical protein